MSFLKFFYGIFFHIIPTFYYSLMSGIPYDYSHVIKGRIRIIRRHFYYPGYKNRGTISIGKNFTCNNKLTSNSIGLIQPCIFNISALNSKIIIGDNVGISGSTIKATASITIGNNVLIGSGCLISDNDSHPIHYQDRILGNNNKTKSCPIKIKDNVFIGARSIILKGITIGEGAVIGAGSVVSKDVPPLSIVCGNPAKVVKYLE
jgi:acetyltransferase-like isoleucine patch superfamily enzyme